MDAVTRIEQALQAAIGRADVPGCPPRLAAAMRHAVFPRGARVRPRLCLAVAARLRRRRARISRRRRRVDRAAALRVARSRRSALFRRRGDAAEPAFGPSRLRRTAGRAGGRRPHRARVPDAGTLRPRTAAAGATCHDGVPLGRSAVRHCRGPGLGMRAACRSWPTITAPRPARCSPPPRLRGRRRRGGLRALAPLGEKLGEAYQAADDIRDAAADPDEIGKPTGRDAALGRPNAVIELGLDGAIRRLEQLVGEAIAAIPPCRGAADLKALILLEAKRLLPKKLAQHAA